MPGLLDLVAKGVRVVYGFFNLGVFVGLAALDGSIFRRVSEQERKDLLIAQSKFWKLSNSPFGLKHRFFMLKDGRELHYVEKLDENSNGAPPKNLVVFIHGFPDSWTLWQRLLISPKLSEDAVLIAVDLPGYGGSDSLADYSAGTVLEAMASFVIGMRERYLAQSNGQLLVVSHDWGSIIAFRLAAEAPQIANRFIISSAILPEQMVATATAHLKSSRQMLHTWLHRPRSLSLLKNALRTISPLLSQARKSGYIFVFNLPQPFANYAGRMGSMWFLRLLHKLSRYPGELTRLEAAECMAGSLGPGAAQCGSGNEDELVYPESVKHRTHDGGWFEKIRLYREGLAISKWDKSLELIVRLSELEPSTSRRSSSGAGLFDTGPPGCLKAPVTVVYGKLDPAFEPRMALEGMVDYLAKGSQVIVLEKGGHWVPVEKGAAEVLEECVRWALDGEIEPLKAKLGSMVMVEKV